MDLADQMAGMVTRKRAVRPTGRDRCPRGGKTSSDRCPTPTTWRNCMPRSTLAKNGATGCATTRRPSSHCAGHGRKIWPPFRCPPTRTRSWCTTNGLHSRLVDFKNYGELWRGRRESIEFFSFQRRFPKSYVWFSKNQVKRDRSRSEYY